MLSDNQFRFSNMKGWNPVRENVTPYQGDIYDIADGQKGL